MKAKRITGFVRCLEDGCGHTYMTIEPLAAMWCATYSDKHEEETGHTNLEATFGQWAGIEARRHAWDIK